MERGTKFLFTSALRAAHTANALTPFARDGGGALPSFAFGLVGSEFARDHSLAFGLSALRGLTNSSTQTKGGKLGLLLTAASAYGMWKAHERSLDAPLRVERALADALGDGYRTEMAASPLVPRTTDLPTFPKPSVRARYVREGHVEYGDHGRRTSLDIWRRSDLPLDGKAPVLFQVHGGGWITGDKEGQAYPLMTHLAERGWVCVSVTYRLSPKAVWPAHLVDVKKALAWVKENIGAHGGDPDWVAITGGSAGGHLCALAALTQNDPQFQPGFEDADTSVRAAVPFYGVYDWTGRDGIGSRAISRVIAERVVQQPMDAARDIWDQASPMSHVAADAVPFLFAHGTNDSLVPIEMARSMVDKLRAVSRNPVAYVEFPGAQHAFDAFSSNRTDAVVAGVERFLNVIRTRSRTTATQLSTN